MAKPSNLYAEKAYSEHPLALWALDDVLDVNKIVSTDIENYYGIPAEAYGLQSNPGYYIANQSNSNIYATNAGIPLVYGASNVTALSPHKDLNVLNPSLIVPGFGFLNELGQYQDLTFEMWIRINTSHPEPQRIFGNLYGTDGLYVNGPFLTLKIGDNLKSHYIGEWSRPLLVNIGITKNASFLMINGERVFTIDYITSDLVFPSKFDSFGNDQDWLAFYVNDDIAPFEIDCIAIYPYKIAEVVAKRRFVYGQGVESPENSSSLYNSVSALIDYSFANYANNYNYPDIGKWNQAIYDNLEVTQSSLSVPNYDLPRFVFNTKTQEQWETDMLSSLDEDNLYIDLIPNLENWGNESGYLAFDNFKILKQDIVGIFGVFNLPVERAINEEQVLFRIENAFNKDYLSINIAQVTDPEEDGLWNILYKFKYGRSQETVLYKDTRPIDFIFNDDFIAGFNIKTLKQKFTNLSSFFGKQNQLRIYVGGPNIENNIEEYSNFRGKIKSFNLCTERNLKPIVNVFNSNGFMKNTNDEVFYSYLTIDSEINNEYEGDPEDTGLYTTYNYSTAPVLDGGSANTFLKSEYDLVLDVINNHRPSYQLGLFKYFNTFKLDINVSGYWEDYVPLNYFSKYVKQKDGSKKYSVEYIQFNINYPEPQEFLQQFFNTSESFIKTYITFQYLSRGIETNQSNFTRLRPARKDGIIVPDEDWLITKYEITNNSIIYMPPGVAISELALVMHIEFDVKTIKVNPLTIKTLQLASQIATDVGPTKIGSKFGTKISPYNRQGIYYDYKSYNPLTIYKSSTPHLYLTAYTGIQLRGNTSPKRGYSIVLNENQGSDYQVGAYQMAIRYQDAVFPISPTRILELDNGHDQKIRFYLKALSEESLTTGVIYGKTVIQTSTGQEEEIDLNIGATSETGTYLYLNGELSDQSGLNVNSVIITPKQWNLFGVQFKTKFIVDDRVGSISVTGPLLTNAISAYRVVSPKTIDTKGLLPWNNLLVPIEYTWQNVSLLNWQDILYTTVKSSQNINMKELYNTFVGTNKIVVEDDFILRFSDYRYKTHTNVVWQTQFLNAV